MSNHQYQPPLPSDTLAVWKGFFQRQRAFALHAFDQINDEQFFAILAPGLNSCAIIANHLAGNMRSRWTDFLTTDGEKPDRDRDREFDPPDQHTPGERAKIMERFEQGWAILFKALDQLTPEDLSNVVKIRTVEHPVHAAIVRQIDHYSFHIGQINIIARQLVGTDNWNWFTLAPGATKPFNAKLLGN